MNFHPFRDRWKDLQVDSSSQCKLYKPDSFKKKKRKQMKSPKRSAPSLPRGFLYIPWYILQSQTFLPHTMDHSHIAAALSAPHGGDASDAAKRGKKRGSYNCGRCGLPKKGHNCTVKTPASTAAATPDSSLSIVLLLLMHLLGVWWNSLCTSDFIHMKYWNLDVTIVFVICG